MINQEIMALDGKYLVRSSDGKTYYLVNLIEGKCDCLDWFYRSESQVGYECRHIRQALEYRAEHVADEVLQRGKEFLKAGKR